MSERKQFVYDPIKRIELCSADHAALARDKRPIEEQRGAEMVIMQAIYDARELVPTLTEEKIAEAIANGRVIGLVPAPPTEKISS